MTDLASRLAAANLSSPMLPENRADPYPIYDFIRLHEPVHHAPDGSWVLTRYDHASSVLRDPRLSTSPQWLGEGNEIAKQSLVRQAGSNLMMFLDPPDHTRLRALVSSAFTPRMVESMRAQIQRLVDGLIDEVVEQGRMDVVADLAYPLPAMVICELLGVPVADREQFKGWASDASRLLDGYLEPDAQMRGMVAAMHLFQYFNDLVDERTENLRQDLLSALITTEGLTRSELMATVTLLFVAGFETTMNLIGNGVLALLRNRDQLERLTADRSLLRPGVEELARFDSPVHVTARIATVDVEIGGEEIPAGDQLVVVLGAANRDPAQFPDPHRLDVGRNPNRHLAFGGGPHFCLGASLARLEGQVAIETMLDRLSGMELVTTVPTYREHFVIRGVTRMEVAFAPGPRRA